MNHFFSPINERLLMVLWTVCVCMLWIGGFSSYALAQSHESTSRTDSSLFIAERGLLDPRSMGIERGMLSAISDAGSDMKLYGLHPDMWSGPITDDPKPIAEWLPATDQVDLVIASWIGDLEFALEHYPETPLINLSPRVVSEHHSVANIGQDFAERVAKTLSWYMGVKPFTGEVYVVLGDFSPSSGSANIIRMQLQTLKVEETRMHWIS